jgi:hypothetical protein
LVFELSNSIEAEKWCLVLFCPRRYQNSYVITSKMAYFSDQDHQKIY